MLTHLLFTGFVLAATVLAVAFKKLSRSAGVAGALLATAIYCGVGWWGVALLATFFVLATAATGWQRQTKEGWGLAQAQGRRSTAQVLANGGVAAALGLFGCLFPAYASLALYLIAAAFSSATADTLSSELGTVYGRRFYDVLTLRKGRRGNDGVVSLEGTVAGLAGSIAVAVVYSVAAGWAPSALFIVVAGTVGNLVDSWLGATLERKDLLGNNAVNFLNTLAAAIAAWALWLL